MIDDERLIGVQASASTVLDDPVSRLTEVLDQIEEDMLGGKTSMDVICFN